MGMKEDVYLKKQEDKNNMKGSYTVEASLLMGLLLMVFVSIIYIGFYFHDQGFVMGAAYESACQASLHREDPEYSAEAVSGKLVKGRLLGTAGVEVTAQKNSEKAVAGYEGSFLIPGMISPFWGKEKLQIHAKISMSIQKPSEKIQKIRGAAKIVQRVRGD